MAEKKRIPGQNTMKDRLTFALCAKAGGDYKIKPLFVYRSENPKAFSSYKILKKKNAGQVERKYKGKGNQAVLCEVGELVFGLDVKKYLQENNLLLEAFIVLDNLPAHSPNLKDDILEGFKFIKVLYLPPNTTTILQLARDFF